MSITGDKSDEEYSVIGDKGEIGFIDFQDDRSVCSYDPGEEGPVVISVPFPFVEQKPQSVLVDGVAADSITIKNTTEESVELWGIQIYASNPEDTFSLSLMEPSKPGFVGSSSLEDRVLHPRKTLTIWLSCKPKNIGMHTCIVHFDVGDDKIERVVFLLAEDSISKALASKKPYQRGRRKAEFVVDSYVLGVRPARTNNRIFRNRLPIYEIPKDIREQLANKQVPDAIMGGLSKKNYVQYFSTLLIMEELRMEEDIRAYDMERVTMKSKGRQFLILEVLGLAERRPSLVHGDSVYAKLVSEKAHDSPVYEGCIHRVEADHVYLRFADDFHQRHFDRNSYNIRFMYNRVNMRRLYQATEAAEGLHTDFLFPSKSVVKRKITPSSVVPVSGDLNQEQQNAVGMIMGCKGGGPYVIIGPPGTGKTMTLVEAVLQLYANRKNSRILICAASNCAADHVLDKILDKKGIQLRENEIFRLNASSRPYDDMKPDLLRFCFFEDSIFKCPPLKALLHYRIIITTYMSSSLLHAEDVKKGNFSHIILDEAGQASEPETMVPISNLCQKGTVVVLAGDPMQLGPVIFSPEAKGQGLGKSYLERLYECEFYSEGDEGYVTTLLRNYRSHPEILQLPSELFYNGELVACHEAVKSAPWADLLPNKDFPILFTGVEAYDEREGDNPSWFNRTEASLVVKFIKKLTSRNVAEDHIGVITPYRQQVAKIRKALEDSDILDVKIGSVEQFQGQEREVIIISTVRSTIKHDDFDRAYYLGFLSNPKRFNVAITRARSLLVIIGNPHIICKDPFWEKLLWRCVDNNSYEGCSLPDRRFYNYDNSAEQGWSQTEELETKDRWSPAIDQAAIGSWADAISVAEETGTKCGQEVSWQEGLSKPVKEEDGWSDEAEPEHGQEVLYREGFSKPVKDKDGWSDEADPERGQEVAWRGLPKPAKDGNEWSDEADPERGQEDAWRGLPKPAKDGNGWSDEAEPERGEEVAWRGLPKPSAKDRNGWCDEAEPERGQEVAWQGLPKPSAKDGNGWSDEAELKHALEVPWQKGFSESVKDGDGWSDVAEPESGQEVPWQEDLSKPVKDKDGWSDEAEPERDLEVPWGEEFCKPIKDEDEWSDGWK